MQQIRRYLVFISKNMRSDIRMDLLNGHACRPRKDTSGRCGNARIRAAPAGMHHRKASRAGQDNRYAIGKAKHDGHLRLAKTYQQELGLEGLLLRADGKPVAFTAGKSLGGDTYDVFFEKAHSEIQGAYPMINREFARWIRKNHPEIRYLNREDDMGEENLRKAKLSYHPDLLLEKYVAELKEGETLQ